MLVKPIHQTLRSPLMFRHFGTGEFGMGNDAYHLLVTAKTGTGKSTISKMISICYARYPEMAQFIIDPVGEFAERFRLNLRNIYQGVRGWSRGEAAIITVLFSNLEMDDSSRSRIVRMM